MSIRIGELARRSGVGVSALRAWERRFGFLDPSRSSGHQRLYTESDLERVCAVRRMTAEGMSLAAAVARTSTIGAGAGALPDEAEALLLHQIVQAANDGIWVSREGVTRFVNRRMAELLRCSVSELLMRPVLDFVAPESLPAVAEWGEVGRAGQRNRNEIVLRCADGCTFPAEITTSPLFDPAGRYDGAVGVVRDMTDRNAAAREAQFRMALLDAVGEAVAAGDRDGKVVYLNPAAERLFGWRASEVMGKNGLALMPAPTATEEGLRIHAKLLSGRHHTGRMRLTRRDGSEFVANMTSAPVFGERADIIGVIAVFTDLTERQELQDELRARELELETIALLGSHALRRATGAASTTDAIIAESLETIRRVAQLDRTMLLDVASGSAELVLRCASPTISDRVVLPVGGRSLTGYTAMMRRTVVVEDTRTEKRFDSISPLRNWASGSAIAAPVFESGRVRAVLIAEGATAHAFPLSQVRFIECVANIIGTALKYP
jgi:PAS domain S-box-containing protein